MTVMMAKYLPFCLPHRKCNFVELPSPGHTGRNYINSNILITKICLLCPSPILTLKEDGKNSLCLKHMLTENQNQRNITDECVVSERIISDWRTLVYIKYIAVVGTIL